MIKRNVYVISTECPGTGILSSREASLARSWCRHQGRPNGCSHAWMSGCHWMSLDARRRNMLRSWRWRVQHLHRTASNLSMSEIFRQLCHVVPRCATLCHVVPRCAMKQVHQQHYVDDMFTAPGSKFPKSRQELCGHHSTFATFLDSAKSLRFEAQPWLLLKAVAFDGFHACWDDDDIGWLLLFPVVPLLMNYCH